MTKSATEIRSKIILGDEIVKQEIIMIDKLIDIASNTGQVSIIVDSGTMAGNYNYGDWWFLEELFVYGNAYRGNSNTGGGALSRLPNLTHMTMPEVIASIDNVTKTRHKQINSVISHYRKFGYQIHSGNYFDANSSNPIKWFISWDATIFDHIFVIDDTLVIGKPDQIAPNGTGPAPVGPTETREPVQSYPQTRIEFFGLGNKSNTQINIQPSAAELPLYENLDTNIDSKLANITTDPDTGELVTAPKTGNIITTAIIELKDKVDEIQHNLNGAFGTLAQTGLIRGEFDENGNDWSVESGIKNFGSGVGRDLSNLEKY